MSSAVVTESALDDATTESMNKMQKKFTFGSRSSNHISKEKYLDANGNGNVLTYEIKFWKKSFHM